MKISVCINAHVAHTFMYIKIYIYTICPFGINTVFFIKNEAENQFDFWYNTTSLYGECLISVFLSSAQYASHWLFCFKLLPWGIKRVYKRGHVPLGK